MEYVSQAILLLLALFGTFFKCVREDSERKTVCTRIGLPRPTAVGIVIAILLACSFGLSLSMTWQSNIRQVDATWRSEERESQLRSDLGELSRQNSTLQSSLGSISTQLVEAAVELEKVQDQLRATSEMRGDPPSARIAALQAAVLALGSKLGDVEDELTTARLSSPVPSVGWITVRNYYRGEISVWVDGERVILQQNESTSVRVSATGSDMKLYSCGWTAAQTSPGQHSGCRLISYTALPGQAWDVVETPPSPRIVMSLR